jgi:hypothetical protein
VRGTRGVIGPPLKGLIFIWAIAASMLRGFGLLGVDIGSNFDLFRRPRLDRDSEEGVLGVEGVAGGSDLAALPRAGVLREADGNGDAVGNAIDLRGAGGGFLLPERGESNGRGADFVVGLDVGSLRCSVGESGDFVLDWRKGDLCSDAGIDRRSNNEGARVDGGGLDWDIEADCVARGKRQDRMCVE